MKSFFLQLSRPSADKSRSVPIGFKIYDCDSSAASFSSPSRFKTTVCGYVLQEESGDWRSNPQRTVSDGEKRTRGLERIGRDSHDVRSYRPSVLSDDDRSSLHKLTFIYGDPLSSDSRLSGKSPPYFFSLKCRNDWNPVGIEIPLLPVRGRLREH